MNTFGTLFRLTTFGESHGAAIGGVIDGCPAGITLDLDFIQAELDRRRPGQSRLTTARKEGDRVELLSGIMESATGELKTTGTPIGFIVRNENQHSNDYDDLRDVFRPSHADYTYYKKYGLRDHRGGGRSSARETISRVVAGAIAKLCLRQLGIDVKAWTQQVGDIACERDWTKLDLSLIESNDVRCPDPAIARQMEDLILQVKGEGDTIGGIIAGVITGCPAGLGEPVFGKLHAQLGAAMLSINAVKGFEYGDGFAMAEKRGSEVNDQFKVDSLKFNEECSDSTQRLADDKHHSTFNFQLQQTTPAASRAASATANPSPSAWPSNPWLPYSANKRPSTFMAIPSPSTHAVVTIPVSCPAPCPSWKPWPPSPSWMHSF